MIPSAGPSITEHDVAIVTQAMRDGWYQGMSRYVDELEHRFRVHTGMTHAMATSSCSGALHLAVMALGIQPGDEIIVPNITWVASASPACYVGARLVFADIDARTWCLDPESFERAITPRTKAVVAVGLLGNMPDMDAIMEIANRHGIAVIEDAAESIGAESRGRKAGSLGHIGVYSFNGTKLMVTGEGGMIVTSDDAIFDRLKPLAHHGITRKPGDRYFWASELGYKYKMSNIQAALGVAQFSRLDELVEERRRHFFWYKDRLGDIEGVTLNHEAEGTRSTFWLTTAIVDPAFGITKEEMCAQFQENGIDGRPFFYPLSEMPPFRPHCDPDTIQTLTPVSYDLSARGVCLPSAATLTEAQVDRVCDVFRRKILRLQS